jgi:hypothetical protein
VQANRNTDKLFGPIGKCFDLANTLAHAAAQSHTLAMYASLVICDRLSYAPYFCPKIQALPTAPAATLVHNLAQHQMPRECFPDFQSPTHAIYTFFE